MSSKCPTLSKTCIDFHFINFVPYQVEDSETQDKDEPRDEPMTGDNSLGESPSPWGGKEVGAVGSECSGGAGCDEPPQLSSSPSVRAVQPQRTMQLPSATQLFVIRPVNNRAQNLMPPAGEPLEDKGESGEEVAVGDSFCLNFMQIQ